MATKTFDARGMACPLPVVNAKKESEEMTNGGTLIILVDNEIAVQNLTKFGNSKGFTVSSEKKTEKDFTVTFQIPENSTTSTPAAESAVPACTKQDQLPEIILCYNSGASLTCEDSDSLEDLKSLEAEGVKILTCGTCLDFYGLKEKLAVGGITNMYEIVEIMESAGTIVRP